MSRTDTVNTALILSGGGVRGAYQAGVVSAIIDILEPHTPIGAPPPFNIFAGTSVGAINASFLAASTHRPDLDIRRLQHIWTHLKLRTHLRFDPLGFFGLKRAFPTLFPRSPGSTLGRSLLEAAPLEDLVRNHIPWSALHRNTRAGRTHALIVPALQIGTGRTTVFAELAPEARLRPTRRPRRHALLEAITADHVLASAALPLLFPARRIHQRFYADGGLRYNTPIAPAIRVGAQRLVVISLLYEEDEAPQTSLEVRSGEELYPSPTFLAGKVLNALLLDPVQYDLQLLERINRLMDAFESSLDAETLTRIRRVIEDTRGMSYRKIDTLVIRPSENIGAIAADHIRANLPRWKLTRFTRWLLEQMTGTSSGHHVGGESDFSSYLLFDGPFAQKLIDLGYRDTLARRDRVLEFFT